ncbi:MAG: GreA/GreB family elongation factor [Verrucomicrobia bacterium]|nr:GreA/GreB family elongation factor [Verrucomicrobiota bacterium]
MSKAFTKESDDAPDEPPAARPLSALPPGAKNYLTADGAEAFREELRRLGEQRAQMVNSADDPEGKRRLRAVDQRMLDLESLLATAEIVTANNCAADEVCFGSRVTVREGDGTEHTYRIVGVDEADFDRGWVSWISPIARALLGARRGERVAFSFPSGAKELEIVSIVS